jgi:hypothetical protein
MRLSELLHREVVGPDGASLGQVRDVRLVPRLPVDGAGDARLRVDALVVGNGGIGIRLGYERNGVRGPWLIAAIAHRLERGLDEIAWSDIEWTETPEPLRCRTARP